MGSKARKPTRSCIHCFEISFFVTGHSESKLKCFKIGLCKELKSILNVWIYIVIIMATDLPELEQYPYV